MLALYDLRIDGSLRMTEAGMRTAVLPFRFELEGRGGFASDSIRCCAQYGGEQVCYRCDPHEFLRRGAPTHTTGSHCVPMWLCVTLRGAFFQMGQVWDHRAGMNEFSKRVSHSSARIC